MLWFDGSIRNAVDKVKSSGVAFLVFVQGEDSLSKKYESFFNEEIKINPKDYVALKITHDSVALQQFKEVYVTVPIPSVFLIENNGKPMKIVSSDQTSDIQNAITNAITKANKKKSCQNIPEKKTQEIPMNNKKCLEKNLSKNTQHVKNIGHKLLDITEEEIKQRLNEIRGFPRFLVLDKPSSFHCPSFPQSSSAKQSARIQFRLPNNEMPSWEFPNQSTLGDVRAYVQEKMRLTQTFKLLRTYPRTTFTPQDEDKTLEELSLTPNATLIVVPVQDQTVQAKMKSLIVRQNFVLAAMKTILQPFFSFMKYFKKHVLRMEVDNENTPQRLVSETAVEKILNKKTSTSNIHGFNFNEDSDSDPENPDNGNSTLQRFKK